MPTLTQYRVDEPIPLDIADVRKTQRRVAALLFPGRYQKVPDVITKKKHGPHNFCYVCSRLDPGGRFIGNPYKYIFAKGYLEGCEHVPPPPPHPTVLGHVSRFGTPDSKDEDGPYFVTDNRVSDALPSNLTRFMMSPAFDTDTKRRSDGRFLPLVSENTFLTTNTPRLRSGSKRHEDNSLSLPSLSTGKSALVGGGVHTGDGQLETRCHDGNDKDWEEDTQNLLEEEESFDKFDVSSRSSLKSGTRIRISRSEIEQKQEGIGYVSNVFVKNKLNKARGELKLMSNGDTMDDDEYDRSKSKELSFVFKRNDTFSTSGSMTKVSPDSSPDFVFSRIRSATWCECSDVDISTLRCRECYKSGSHEGWCVSKLGICPKCNKPVKRKRTNSFRRQSTFSPTRGLSKTSTDLSTIFQHDRECSSTQNDESKSSLKQILNNSFVKDSKKKRKKNGRIVKTEKEKGNSEVMDSPKKALEGIRSRVPKPKYNVHKQAYLLALSDSRAQQMRNDPFFLDKIFSRRYFSYFPLYSIPGSMPSGPAVGIKTEHDARKKNLIIKDGMKHIFGDIELADYYPNGKHYPKDGPEQGTERHI